MGNGKRASMRSKASSRKDTGTVRMTVQLWPRMATRSLLPVATSINWSVWTYCPAVVSPASWTRSALKWPGSGSCQGRRPAGIDRIKGLGGDGRGCHHPTHRGEPDPLQALQQLTGELQLVVLG